MVTLWGRERTREELLPRAGRLEQIAAIRLAEGGDGAERGARQLRCWPGAGLGSEILADRGFDIGGTRIGGRPLAWSPPAGLAGPRYREPAGTGCFRGYPRGPVSTCGLDHTLPGGADDATVSDYPHHATETYGLHGRYTGLPARLVGYGASWDRDDCVPSHASVPGGSRRGGPRRSTCSSSACAACCPAGPLKRHAARTRPSCTGPVPQRQTAMLMTITSNPGMRSKCRMLAIPAS